MLFVTIGLLVIQLLWALQWWPMLDMNAYWDAALRLRAGEPLYPAYADPSAPEVYRYSPWFAQLWIPITLLPRELVNAAWGTLLAVATAVSLVPLLRTRSAVGIAAAALIGSHLLLNARYGNVQPLMIAALVWGAERRSGPLWIAIAASLKFFPLLYVLIYVGRREWGRAAATLALTGVLVAPIFLFDLGAYITTPVATPLSLYTISPLVWAAGAAVAFVAALVLAWRRSRFAWLAAGTAVLLCPPQGHLSYTSFLLVGTRGERSPASAADSGQRAG